MSPRESLRVVIVGRPNVGKSTLFNRLLGRRRALVHDEAGVTRDRLEEKAQWILGGRQLPITLVDTGGLGGDRFAQEIERQVEIAIAHAHVVLAVFDGQSGLTPADEDVLRQLKRGGLRAPIIGVVNKVDAESHESRIMDFYQAGLDETLSISAEHGRGIEDLKEMAYRLGAEYAGFGPEEKLEGRPEDQTEEQEAEQAGEDTSHIPRIAVVGRPNVGKSTLVNALLGQERMITSPIAGTTIDAVDSLAELNGRELLLIDTAGIRRKSKTERGVEVLSVVQAKKALERCDVAILLLDGETGITDQDEKIGGLIEEVGCGVIIAINKWDTQRNNPKFTKDAAAEIIRKRMAYLSYAPMLFLSAARAEGFGGLPDLVDEILSQRQTKIPTHEFSEWVRVESAVHNPKNARFYLSHQTGRNPPTFVCHVSDPDKVHFSLKRHLVNALRARWGFMGNPVRLIFKKAGKDN